MSWRDELRAGSGQHGGKCVVSAHSFLHRPGGLHWELKLGGLIETISLFRVVINERNVIILFHCVFSLARLLEYAIYTQAISPSKTGL